MRWCPVPSPSGRDSSCSSETPAPGGAFDTELAHSRTRVGAAVCALGWGSFFERGSSAGDEGRSLVARCAAPRACMCTRPDSSQKACAHVCVGAWAVSLCMMSVGTSSWHKGGAFRKCSSHGPGLKHRFSRCRVSQVELAPNVDGVGPTHEASCEQASRGGGVAIASAALVPYSESESSGPGDGDGATEPEQPSSEGRALTHVPRYGVASSIHLAGICV